MQRHVETQEGSFNPEFTVKKPLPAFVVDTSGIPSNYRDPFNFSDLNLLGLDIHIRNVLLRKGIENIRQLNEEDASLKARRIGPRTIATARAAIERFRVNLKEYTTKASGVAKPDNTTISIKINAIDWLNSHNLTWEGTTKTPLMSASEKAIGQNLGDFLISTYTREGLSPICIAKMIYDKSNSEIRVTTDQVVQFMRQFGISRRNLAEARHVAEIKIQPSLLPNITFENAQPGKVKEIKLRRIRRVIEEAKANGLWDSLNPREQLILSRLYEDAIPLSQQSVAVGLGVSKQRVESLAGRAVNKLIIRSYSRGMTAINN